MIELITLLKIEFLLLRKIKLAHYTDYSLISDEQLDRSITEAQRAKDDALAFLKMLIHERDRRIESKHLETIIAGLSENQKQAMYAQIVGVKTAHSGANAKDGK